MLMTSVCSPMCSSKKQMGNKCFKITSSTGTKLGIECIKLLFWMNAYASPPVSSNFSQKCVLFLAYHSR